ncbi:MAG TPA: hypothetical protein PLV87_17475, partial [Opitutaceae bacterium]|nr:hypothetical protein [Opitutaceae bacterium]
NEIVRRGITVGDKRSPRYFGGKFIVPYDKGGEGDSEGGWLPKYLLPTEYFIDWSESSVSALRSDTIADIYKRQGKSVAIGKPHYNKTLASALRNQEFYFRRGITFSHTGMYSPSFRESGSALFDMAGSTMFLEGSLQDEILSSLNSRIWVSLFRNYVNATVNTSEDPIKDVPLPLNIPEAASVAVRSIVGKQARDRRYDYASNEQLEIDRLVYAAYGLNDGDIKEVENWYARRYPKLAEAQRRNLAARLGRTEEQLLDRP